MSITSAEITIAAPADLVMDVIGDIAAYPEWVKGTAAATVTVDGTTPLRPAQAAFVIQAAVSDDFELAYTYPPGDREVRWTLVRSTAQSAQSGRYLLTERPTGTTVRYELSITPRMSVPSFMRSRIEKGIVETALGGLKQRVEALATDET